MGGDISCRENKNTKNNCTPPKIDVKKYNFDLKLSKRIYENTPPKNSFFFFARTKPVNFIFFL